MQAAKIATTPFHQFSEGQSYEATFNVSETTLQSFIEATGDKSSLHVSDVFAKSRGFDGRVIHGAYLISLATGMVGMQFPGEHAVIHSVEFRFRKPAYLGQPFQIKLVVESLSVAVQTMTVAVTVVSKNGSPLAQGKIQVGFTGK